MFEAFRRSQLQREGLCGRTRLRHQDDDDFKEQLRSHPAVMWTLLVAFVLAALSLLRMAGGLAGGIDAPGGMNQLTICTLAVVALLHLHIGHKERMRDNRLLLLILGTVLLHLVAMILCCRLAGAQGFQGNDLRMVLPHAVAPLVLSVMLGRRMGLYAAMHCSLLGCALRLPGNPLTYLIASLIIGMAAVMLTRKVRRRNRLFIAGCYLGLCAGGLNAILTLAERGELGADWLRVITVPLMCGVGTGLVVGGLLPVLESTFGVITDVTWLELADLNHPLMRRLSMETPGTYHHSLMVANLAEAAAEAIGCNATLCRVCAYFHDIGKINKPDYFIENMAPGDNPHAELTARMSALVLIAHVKDGVDIAIKNNLNHRIIDVIEQHHGTSLVYYFYRQALDQRAAVERLVEEDKAREDDVPHVAEDVFRYPGPKPQTKEAAIISLADAVESTSRTIDKPNAARVESMVNEIVQNRMMDGQLDECDLTLSELAGVKASFVKSLLSMMHSRIKYQAKVEKKTPDLEGEENSKIVPIDINTVNPAALLGGGERKPATRKRGTKASA
jgi:cyclic-di-AMP phosphodiesterase PgpH